MSTGYREGPDDTFEANGVFYNLNRIFELVEHEPIQYIEVSKLAWVLEHAKGDPSRVEKADLEAPILVTRWQGKELVVDGLHRLTKAVQEHIAKLPYRRVSPFVMQQAKVSVTHEALPAWLRW